MTAPWVLAFAAQSLVLLVMAFLLVGTLRRIASVLEGTERRLAHLPEFGPGGLPPGSAVPPFVATSDDGSRFTKANLEGSRSLLLFLSGDCQPCRTVAHDLVNGEPLDGVDLYAVLRDRSDAEKLGLGEGIRTLVEGERSLTRAFQVVGTPHAVVVADGRVAASGVPTSLRALREVIDRAEDDGARAHEETTP